MSPGWLRGLHADYTETRQCLPRQLDSHEHRNRTRKSRTLFTLLCKIFLLYSLIPLNLGRFEFFTILRDPMDRYLSEWLHIRRHGTSWNNSTLRCNGKLPNSSHYRPCPFSKATNNSHLSLGSFASGPNSLSNNRQTRMIASIDELGCYSKLSEWTRPTCGAFLTSPQIDLLASAVDDLLRSFVTFGLIEHIVYRQYMYRVHFGLIFRKPFSKPLNATHVSLPVL